MNEPATIRIECVHAVRLCYAMQQNAQSVVSLLDVHNDGSEPVREVEVHVTISDDLALPCIMRVDAIAPGTVHRFANVPLSLRPEALANCNERRQVSFVVEVKSQGVGIARMEREVTLLAFNEWPGDGAPHELLAAFVLPNHPAIAPILRDAAGRLQEATGSASLDAYQTRDPERARAIVRAIYEAVLARGIVYVSPPASFESQGQKVRTPEQVLGDRLGTCLDLAVLIAAAIEQSGLHALVVFEEGHAIAGAFLQDEVFAEAALADPLPLRKRVDLGRVVLFECTTMCAGQAQPFARAVELGMRAVHPETAFVCVVDITMARRRSVRPLPIRTTEFRIDVEATAAAVPQDAPTSAKLDLGTGAAKEPEDAVKDRLGEWQRRLLDLSLRNRLLNFVETKRSVRMQTSSLQDLTDALWSGRQFRVAPRAELTAMALKKISDAPGEREEALAKLLKDDLKDLRLHAELDEDQLAIRMLELFRQARVGSEESGVNTLFLALGFLRWYETETSKEPRRAPLLLVPLRLERISIAEGFVLAVSDEEPRINETLVQKLENDFGIRVPAIAELDGENGLNSKAVLDAFRRATVDIARWEVETTAQVGIFSFAKFLMWADLQEGREHVMAHEFLSHLVKSPKGGFVDGGGEWPTPQGLDALLPQDLLCPMDADSSQLCAVVSAASGRSFVLEGPPGTGKSQTITNLIAQCLASGKRVLFVAEKRAALEVVQRRLQNVGLAQFCLELHSNKGQKRAVVEQLGRLLELGASQEPDRWQQNADDLLRLRHQLNAVVAAVHEKRGAGFSVFEAAARAVADRRLPLVLGLELDVDAERLRQQRDALSTLVQDAEKLGELRSHPWFGVQQEEWSASLAKDACKLAEQVFPALAAARSAYAEALRSLAVPTALADFGRARLETLATAMEILAAGPLPQFVSSGGDLAAAHARAVQCLELGEAVARATVPLSKEWQPGFLSLDHAALSVAILRNERAFPLLRWWRLRPVRAQLLAVCRGELPDLAGLRRALGEAVSLLDLQRKLAAKDVDGRESFGDEWRGAESDFAALRAACERAAVLSATLPKLVEDESARLAVRTAAVATAATEAGRSVMARAVIAHKELRAALLALQAPLQLCFDRAFGDAAAPLFLDAVERRLRGFFDAHGTLRDQCAFQRDAKVARNLGLAPMVDALELGTVAAAVANAAFERSFAHSWLEREVKADPSLQRFRSEDHERRIASFRQLDQQWIKVGGELVRARLAARLPSLRETTAESSEIGALMREIKKQKRHLSPRQLFERIPNILPRLAPCLLMSPMTVAQVLSRGLPLFDLVVFDEASQVPMWDAVGAISRGKSLVVVGDEKQLPPTSFFQGVEDEGEIQRDSEAVDELESVLEECGAAGLKKLFLRWHYRSRHESLIAFSNHHYYENRLFTFPAADRSGAVGVQLVRVDGVYDRAKSSTNRKEAEALVERLVAFLRDPATSSDTYGVVTFSMAQQTLVEDLLEQQRQLHPEIERHFTRNDEPVFVKNLENVQGDERDVMLFSICYGPDSVGKVHMQFGPLNLMGGQRRLNVAITRARKQLLVFSSLRAEQIELQRSQSVGVAHLRSFLDYAARGEAALVAEVQAQQGVPESPFERSVLQALAERGHEVHSQIGCSGYRIDLAVVDPRQKGRYVLGVECDGASYHSAATARDRDRLRQSVLERLGWRMFRIWSTDWWIDQEGELARLDAALQEALQTPVPGAAERVAIARNAASVREPEPSVQEPPPEPPPVVAVPPPVDPELPLYTAVTLPPAGDSEAFHELRSSARIREQVAAVLAQEAPICFSLLVRRIAGAWAIGRVTARVEDRLRSVLGSAVVESDGALWASESDPSAYSSFRSSKSGESARDADEIPPVEIRAAMVWVLQQHGSLAEADLLRETARVFGFARLGPTVRTEMQKGLGDLERRAAVQRNGVSIRPA